MTDWKEIRPSDFIEPRYFVEITFRTAGDIYGASVICAAAMRQILELYDSNRCYDATITVSADGYPVIAFWCDLMHDAEHYSALTLEYLRGNGYEPV